MARKGLPVNFNPALATRRSLLMQCDNLTLVTPFDGQQTIESVTDDITDLILKKIAELRENELEMGWDRRHASRTAEVMVILPATRDTINWLEIERDEITEALEACLAA